MMAATAGYQKLSTESEMSDQNAEDGSNTEGLIPSISTSKRHRRYMFPLLTLLNLAFFAATVFLLLSPSPFPRGGNIRSRSHPFYCKSPVIRRTVSLNRSTKVAAPILDRGDIPIQKIKANGSFVDIQDPEPQP
jgi:hypothetical protein